MASPVQELAESLAKGTTSAVLEFFASKWRILMLFHWPWTIKKLKKEGIYPAIMTIKKTKVSISTRHSMIVRFQIHLTPKVRYHLIKFVIRKEGKSPAIQEWMFNGKDSMFPHILFDEQNLLTRVTEPPYYHSSVTIDKILTSRYYCPEAAFEIPYSPSEKNIKVQVQAETYDMKGKSYELYSEWIEL